MFQQLDLKFFRQHEDLSITFQPGVIALRGRNEKGKTTILEAMAFALGGAPCLRETLDDVVTWGHKTSELKVKMTFSLNGVVYTISRSKSGAEIRNEHRILATGQKEVTKYVETLLGASIEVCQKLMLASQGDIKGALTAGPAAAIKLIEALSNLGVIDTIIGLVQDQLPCGATTAVNSRIVTLEQQMQQPVEDDTGPLQTASSEAEVKLQLAQADYDRANKAYQDIQNDAQKANATVREHERLQAVADRLKADLDRAEAALAAHVIPELPTNLEELRKAVADSNFMERAARASVALAQLKEPENEWEGDYDSLLVEIEVTRGKVNTATKDIQTRRVAIAKLEAQKITQTACGLCGKDLSKVPEVVTKNDQLDSTIRVYGAQIAEAEMELNEASDYMTVLSGIQKAHHAAMAVFQIATEFTERDFGFAPPRWKWTGPTEIKTNGSALKALRTAEAAEAAHHGAIGRQAQLTAEVVRLGQQWNTAVADLSSSADLQAQAVEVLNRAAGLLEDLGATNEPLRNAQRTAQAARQALEVAMAGVRERQMARMRLEGDLKLARQEAAEMDDNNALIRFLREARPLITDQVWAMVMTTVSSYFSDIRGVPSTVSREDNGFKVDGRNISGLSGSTQDALGLAIRKAMTKVFLPNASFMMLDEPAAACDDERETNMLGLIASGGFEQVILVTHSDLADSFANQVVQL